MRLFIAAVASLAIAAPASADLIAGGDAEVGSLYSISASEFTEVADGIFSTVLSLSNVSGNAAFDPNSVNITLGSNGTLHNEQAFGGFGPSPTLAAYNALPGASDPVLDSHFLPTVTLALSEPAEEGTLVPSGAPTSLQGGVAGFGLALTGQFGFQAAESVELAKLVVAGPLNEIEIDYSFSVADGSPTSPGETFSGVITGIPEPSTCILAGLALVGFAARRNG